MFLDKLREQAFFIKCTKKEKAFVFQVVML